MANTSVLNNVYNYYLTTYAPRTNTPSDTHKKSELRSVYNNIRKQSKDSPLFLIRDDQETREYVIDVKENARGLRNSIFSIDGGEKTLSRKSADSVDESVATVTYGGKASEAPPFDLEVERLASPQMNKGKFLDSGAPVELSSGNYSFDIAINDLNYEFQFTVRDSDTNRSLQARLERLINRANIGIDAEVTSRTGGEGFDESSLSLTSVNTGLRGKDGLLFELSDDHTSRQGGVIDYLGIGEVSARAGDASFRVNGESHSSGNNSINVGQLYDVKLTGVGTTSISLKTDIDSMTANIQKVIDSYNQFITSTSEDVSVPGRFGNSQIVHEVSRIARAYSEGLTDIGVNLALDGTLELDSERFSKTLSESDDVQSALSSVRSFTQAISHKAEEISLNPMKYVDQTIVEYKNPGGHNWPSPYVTSEYTGMMFNSYC